MGKCLLLVTVVCSLLIAGCGTVGKSFDSSKVKDIKNQTTTKSDILNWFGVPFKEGTENGNLMWTYQIDEYMMGKTHSRDLVVLFDDKNVVKAYRYTSNMD